MRDLRKRMLALGLTVTFAVGIGLYFWKVPGAAIAGVAGGVAAVFQVYQSLLPPQPVVDEAAKRLSILVKKNWGTWQRVLLGSARPVDVEFEVVDDLRFMRADSSNSTRTLSGILSFYEGLGPQRLVILGAPGSGKTLLAVELALQMLEHAREPATVAVPVSVAGWTGEESLDDWLVDRLAEAYHVPAGVAARLVEDQRILPILDGLDEIEQEPYRKTETVDRVLEVLNTSDDGRNLERVVLTCREDFYKAVRVRGKGIMHATVVRIKELTNEQVSAHIQDRFLADPQSIQRNPGWQHLHQQTESGNPPALVGELKIPWLLALATTVSGSGRATVEHLESLDPVRLKDFLIGEFIPATVALHPKAVTRDRVGKPQLSEVYRSDGEARYDAEAVGRWLTTLARHLGQQPASRVNLEPHRLWLIAARDGKPVRAIHTAIAVPLGILMGALASELADGVPGSVITVATAAVGAGFGLRAGLWREAPPQKAGSSPSRLARLSAWFVKRPSPSRVNILRALTSQRWAPLIAAAMIAAGIVGGLDGGARVGATEALAAGLAACVLTGLSYGTSHAITPEEPLTNDLVFGIVLGCGGGVATGLPGGLTGGLAAHLHLNAHLTFAGSALLAITISVLAGVALGSRTWVRYMIALAYSASVHSLPWRCLKFLDWAATVGLLRVSGIAYQFRHDDLQQHLDRRA